MTHHVGRTIPQPFVTAPLRILLVGGEPKAAAALGAVGGFCHTPEIVGVASVAEALRVLATEVSHAVIADLRLDGVLDKAGLRRLVAAADDRPVAALIDEHDVVDAAEAAGIGAIGFYYRDQLDADLIQRICQIALGRWLRTSGEKAAPDEAAVGAHSIAVAPPLALRSVGAKATGRPVVGRLRARGRRVTAS